MVTYNVSPGYFRFLRFASLISQHYRLGTSNTLEET
jgi:hypothetical protein